MNRGLRRFFWRSGILHSQSLLRFLNLPFMGIKFHLIFFLPNLRSNKLYKINILLHGHYQGESYSGLNGRGRGFLRIGFAPIWRLTFCSTLLTMGSTRYAAGPFACKWSFAMRRALAGDAQGCSFCSTFAPLMRSFLWTM